MQYVGLVIPKPTVSMIIFGHTKWGFNKEVRPLVIYVKSLCFTVHLEQAS